MRILFLTSGAIVPSSRFRVLQYLPYLQSRGHHCTVLPSRPPKYKGLRSLGNRLSELPRAAARLLDWMHARRNAYDVIVIERELFSSGFRALERLFRRIAPALVLDVDDGIFIQHPDKFAALSRLCDLIIAGNELLREKAVEHNRNTIVIPTSLDTVRYTQRSIKPFDNRRPILGWTGMADNLLHLQPIAPALVALRQQTDFELRVICEREPQSRELGLGSVNVQFIPWRESTEIVDLQMFDVGLMPLVDNNWTRYKCGLKILQYMAAGIPAVASPVGVNAEIIQHGANGMLASAPEEWTACLANLLTDGNLRRKTAAAARRTVEAGYSLEVNAPKLEAALIQATNLPTPPNSACESPESGTPSTH